MKLKVLLLSLLLLVVGCSSFRPGWIREDAIAANGAEITEDDFDGPLNGHFDDDGNWVPDDPTIAATYRIPDISSGFLYDVRSQKVTPTIQIELLEFDAPWKYLSTFKIDAGAGYQRAYGYVGILITSIFEISVGVTGGWNFENDDYFYGPSFTIIKF